jgi:hypothetical protein
MEAMGQFAQEHEESFLGLLINYTRFYNPSTTLIYFIGHHEPDFWSEPVSENISPFCPVRYLLEAGAQPDVQGYRLGPLQMAVAAWNLEGVRLLLHFGAGPNYAGDSTGAIWPINSLLADFNRFQGMLPLRICRSRDCVYPESDYRRRRREPSVKTIEQLLLNYSGREFQQEPREPGTE